MYVSEHLDRCFHLNKDILLFENEGRLEDEQLHIVLGQDFFGYNRIIVNAFLLLDLFQLLYDRIKLLFLLLREPRIYWRYLLRTRLSVRVSATSRAGYNL